MSELLTLELLEVLSPLLSPAVWHSQEGLKRECDWPKVGGAVLASDSGPGSGCALDRCGDC